MSGLEIFMVVLGSLACLVLVFFVVGMRNKRVRAEEWKQADGRPDQEALEAMDAQLEPYQDNERGPNMSLSERWLRDSEKEGDE